MADPAAPKKSNAPVDTRIVASKFLRQVIFSLSPEEGVLLAEYVEEMKLPVGAILTQQFAWEKDLFFLCEGEVSIFQLAVLARRLCALQLSDISAPAVLGASSLFMEQLQNDTIVTASDVIIYRLPEEKYRALCEEQPALAVKVLQVAGQQMAFSFMNVHERIQSRMVSQTKDVNAALYLLKKYIGTVRICNPQTAQKLFNLDDAVL